MYFKKCRSKRAHFDKLKYNWIKYNLFNYMYVKYFKMYLGYSMQHLQVSLKNIYSIIKLHNKYSTMSFYLLRQTWGSIQYLYHVLPHLACRWQCSIKFHVKAFNKRSVLTSVCFCRRNLIIHIPFETTALDTLMYHQNIFRSLIWLVCATAY